MNPDKLFDYLDGRLAPSERAALEERLMSDKQLQREFAVARQIHVNELLLVDALQGALR